MCGERDVSVGLLLLLVEVMGSEGGGSVVRRGLPRSGTEVGAEDGLPFELHLPEDGYLWVASKVGTTRHVGLR